MRLLLDTNIYVYMISDQNISHKMALVSSDTKFPFYRKQGLRLIENL